MALKTDESKMLAAWLRPESQGRGQCHKAEAKILASRPGEARTFAFGIKAEARRSRPKC